MAGKKISCSQCRRSYDRNIEYCPYCNSPNPLMVSKSSSEELPLKQTRKTMKKIAINEEELFTDSTEEELSEETAADYSEDEYTDDTNDEYEETYTEESSDEEYVDSTDDIGSDDEVSLDSDDEGFSTDIEPDMQTSELSAQSNRSKIKWTDEPEPDTSNYEDMYDETGEYNNNYDHYYDDTKAKIDGELESLSAGKEKAILKIVGGIAAVIGVIVYLVLTL